MKPCILVVDDDSAIRTMLKNALVAEDYQVIEAKNGFDGVSEVLIGEPSIDLVITDLNMPGLDGVELIKSIPESVPVIVILYWFKVNENFVSMM